MSNRVPCGLLPVNTDMAEYIYDRALHTDLTDGEGVTGEGEVGFSGALLSDRTMTSYAKIQIWIGSLRIKQA